MSLNMEKTGPGDAKDLRVSQASPRLKLLQSTTVALLPEPERVNSSSTVPTVRSVIVILTDSIQPLVKANSDG
jgi:hypothetical protein